MREKAEPLCSFPHSGLSRTSPVSPSAPTPNLLETGLVKPGHREENKNPQAWGTKLQSSGFFPSWHLLLTKLNQPENRFPKSDVKSATMTSAPTRSRAMPLLGHGFHAWGMNSAQRFMNPKYQQNKTKLFLMGTNKPTAETLELDRAAGHFSALDIDDRGGKTTIPGLLSCGLQPKLHQLLLPFSESYLSF